jgi:hypothetical protein
MAAFQFYLQSRKERKVGWVGDDSHVVFGKKNSLVNKEVWDGALLWCNSQFFVTKILVEVFAIFHTVTVKHHSSMWNWLFGLPGQIHCEQSPWCKIKLWACSWLCYSPVIPFLVSMSLDFPCTTHVFFPEHLYNNC